MLMAMTENVDDVLLQLFLYFRNEHSTFNASASSVPQQFLVYAPFLTYFRFRYEMKK